MFITFPATKFVVSYDYNLTYSGSVNVWYKGVLGRVCSQGWTDKEADVLCKQLGYKGGVAFIQSRMNNLPMMIANVSCDGINTNRLEGCKFDDAITSNNGGCDRFSLTAGILCAKTDGKFSFSLVGLSENANIHIVCQSLVRN